MAHKKQQSLQAIEDYYFQKGLRRDALRKATQDDWEYRAILQQRWAKLTKNFAIKPKDRKKYILSTNEDYKILGKIYLLERKQLSQHDRELVKLARTQLEHDWRDPLLRFLVRMLVKYRKNS